MENQKHNILTHHEKDPEHNSDNIKKVKDPVCGMNINPEKATGNITYLG